MKVRESKSIISITKGDGAIKVDVWKFMVLFVWPSLMDIKSLFLMNDSNEIRHDQGE